jgi:hypothetical protein
VSFWIVIQRRAGLPAAGAEASDRSIQKARSDMSSFLLSVRNWSTAAIALAAMAMPVPSAPNPCQTFAGNTFAGKFVGDASPGGGFGPWSITISGGGRLRGVMKINAGVFTASGSCIGTVDGNGRITVSGVESWFVWGGGGQSGFSYTGNVSVSPDDDLVVVLDTGETLVWDRL